MRFIPLTALLLGGCLALPAAASDAQDWLRRLSDASQNQSYHGTFIYERNGSFSTHSIWHQVDKDKVVHDRLLQLDGPAHESFRVNGRTECVVGGLVDEVSDAQAWPARELNANELAKWYDIRVMGNSRVAGRSAVVLGLLPRDQHRYGIELHLDSETGVPLKSLLLNDKGQMLERFQFTQFDASQATNTEPVTPSADCQPVKVVAATPLDAKAWRTDWLPPGFSLSSTTQKVSSISEEPVACLLYDDGLARFSVFLEPLDGATAGDARTQLGPTVAVSRRLATSGGDVMVTVVGEIPLGTAERVALSVRQGEAQPQP
ncbi:MULTISPECIES: MucB/RseB C-terminal domain-containing protein [Pseudomonas]|uniref:Sigma E regulatory protein, MucB/RseB n=1 Tax=Pseudomonas segetis TaxID=298908 RepID=A0A238ZCJ9_9PSED|nr:MULTISPECIES: MucB/RseB C-terminal domain-containing protein [Pseudomonas]SNR80493.1 sigma E regulatory protein, MucB/RseB [Pseudomonas segetis]